ncbi:MAG: hypothetical protein ACI9R3_003317 [Verrucomicrobiales bacterium]
MFDGSLEFRDTLVSEVSRGLEQSLDEAGRAAFKSFIDQYDFKEDQIEHDGRRFRSERWLQQPKPLAKKPSQAT